MGKCWVEAWCGRRETAERLTWRFQIARTLDVKEEGIRSVFRHVGGVWGCVWEAGGEGERGTVGWANK